LKIKKIKKNHYFFGKKVKLNFSNQLPLQFFLLNFGHLFEEIELNFDASFQQILRSELEILWEARSTPTLVLVSKLVTTT
jgi:hypothetical protein